MPSSASAIARFALRQSSASASPSSVPHFEYTLIDASSVASALALASSMFAPRALQLHDMCEA